jgi:hypothetical protein
VAATAIDGAEAPVTGNYLVLVGSFDSGFDGTGTYRLSLAKTGAAVTVSPGDQGGPLTGGSTHTGTMLLGDLDVWTFSANAGDRIGVNVSQLTDNNDFRPWVRLYAPTGVVLANNSGTETALIDGATAPVTGTYLVLVGSFDSGFDGTGTYQVTLAKTPGPVTITPGDDGGAITSGVAQAGTITVGDLDVFAINVVAGQSITVNISETSEINDFRPWIRLWGPNGVSFISSSGLTSASGGPVVAPVTGTYLILVGSFDSGFNGTGTYSITATLTP